MRSIPDSWTYCVVISNERPGGADQRSFKEFVTEERIYFHPYGRQGWPTEPPDFMAFRWNNAVRRIHRVTKTDVVPSLLDRWPGMPDTDDFNLPHAVYELGPQLPPATPIPSGRNYRATRTWVLLDQLQTAATLQDAMKATDDMLAELPDHRRLSHKVPTQGPDRPTLQAMTANEDGQDRVPGRLATRYHQSGATSTCSPA